MKWTVAVWVAMLCVGVAAAAEAPPVPDVEPTASRHNDVVIDGRHIGYTVTAGLLQIRDDHDEPIAAIFYTAYTAGGGARPVTFAFNGGPGSSSVYLNLGALGPARVALPNAKPAGPGPYQLVANNECILGKTDLVFIDAVGTGLSHAIGKSQDRDFWGVDQDVDSFARAIAAWLKLNQRWNSPKLLIGESYGAFRAAGLASVLQERGIPLGGVVLLSGAADVGLRNPGYNDFFVDFLPSLAAVSWYHQRIANRPADLAAFVAEVRAYALGPYAAALTKGNTLTTPEREVVARQVSAYTGLSPEFVLESNLRVDFRRYRKELLRARGETIGALDARYLGTDADSTGETPESDATSDAIEGAFGVVLNDYLFKTLGFKSERRYKLENSGEVQGAWDWRRKVPPDYYPWAARPLTSDLADAMRRNPSLKVLSLFGYYDLAAPFLAGELELQRLPINSSLAANISRAYYEAGHMFYLDPTSRRKMRADLERFIDAAVSSR